MKIFKSCLGTFFLAALLVGVVPAIAETSVGSTPSAPPMMEPTSADQPAVAKLNINTASADEIAAGLHGIGDKKAAEIVRYREANGPFKDTSELLKIKGIGESILKKNESLLAL